MIHTAFNVLCCTTYIIPDKKKRNNQPTQIDFRRSRARAHSRTFNLSGIKMVTEKKKIQKKLKNQHTQSTYMYAVYTGGI